MTQPSEVAAEREARYQWSRRAIEANAALFNQNRLLPDCPTCGGTGNVWGPGGVVYATTVEACPAGCDHGKVTVAQMVALWQAVHARGKGSALIPVVGVNNFATKEHHGASVMLDHLRAVRP